jgi:predicted ATPase/DNA-binding SARP family transcriptional activator
MAVADHVDVRLLGRPAVLVDGVWVEPAPGRVAALLLYLAFHGGWVGRDELVYLFWPDAPEEQARGNLRPLLSRVASQPLGRGVERERSRVRWSVRTDLQRFREAVGAGRWLAAWAAAHGELLAGFTLAGATEFESWLEAERAELHGVVRTAGARAADELASTGDFAAVADVWSALHRADPLDERVLRSYLLALARSGAVSQALAVFERFRRVLSEEFEGEPERSTFDAVEAIRAHAPAVAGAPVRGPVTALEVADGDRAVMPIQPTRFVGRERERTVLMERMQDPACRLLTIVGPGGAGKTRLAVEVAARVGEGIRHGARFVDLAAVDSADALLAVVARGVGLREAAHGGEAEVLLRHLRDREMLLVLDNFEHLAEETGLVRELLAGAPAVKILVTSRVRLAVAGERLFELAGMQYEVSAEGNEPVEAVTLFVRTARRIRPDFVAEGDAARSVSRICGLVEGLPLALELAATWLRVLSVHEIEAELEASVDLLEGAERGALARHAGVTAVFDHSWELLRPRERDALRALSVFRGGWTREAAAAVAGVWLPVLLALVDASLVRREPSGRFGWHPLVRQYALRRAAEHEVERERVAARHGTYFLEVLAAGRDVLRRFDGGVLLRRIEADLPNVQAAWHWGVAHGREDLLAPGGHGVDRIFWAIDRIRLQIALARAALAGATPGGSAWGRAATLLGGALCVGRGMFQAGRVSESTEGFALLEEGLAIAETRGSDEDVAMTLRLISAAHMVARRPQQARPAIERAACIFRRLGDGAGAATMRTFLAMNEPLVEEKIRGYREAIKMARGAEAPMALHLAYANLGHGLLLFSGAYADAAEAFSNALELADGMGLSHRAGLERVGLAEAAAAAGSLEEAREALEMVLDHHARDAADGAPGDIANVSALHAWVAFLAGDAVAAAAWAHRSLVATGVLPPETEAQARTVLASLAIERGDPDEAARELELVRSALVEASRGLPAGTGVPAGDLPLWLRLLAVEAEHALAAGQHDEARAAVAEALSLVRGSEQRPAAAIALAAAARLLDARGDAAGARAVADVVRCDAAAPYDARLIVDRLRARWGDHRDRGAAPWSSEPESAAEPTVFDVAGRVLETLRAAS